MEILFLAHRIPFPPDKGDKIRSYRWLKALAARHSVHLGCFIDDRQDRAHLARAVMEGVAFAFADCLAALKAAGTSVERAMAVGGGSRSRAWLQIIADVLDLPIDIPAEGDFGAGLGAARLGLIAAENSDPIAICRPPAVQETVKPDKAAVEEYRSAFERYRALYPAIREALRS